MLLGRVQVRWHAAAIALGCLLAVPGPAVAQGYDPFGVFGNQWQVGGAVFVSPKFEGADSYRAIGFPFIAPAGLGDGSGFVQIKGADDVRFRVFQFAGFEMGPLAGYRFGRDEDDAAHLQGTGDIDGGLVLGGFVTYRTGPFAFSVSYHHQATGDDTGGLVRFGAEHVGRLAPNVKLTTSVGTNYATDDYMTAFFGVSAAQAGLLPVYSASAGFKDVFIGATAAIDLDDRWTLMLIGRYSRLLGDAADSPIVETENQLYGGAALSYKFSLGR
jgi:outer membrane scaffolding protein for murein synthesis (MipA/OmpV family)